MHTVKQEKQAKILIAKNQVRANTEKSAVAALCTEQPDINIK